MLFSPKATSVSHPLLKDNENLSLSNISPLNYLFRSSIFVVLLALITIIVWQYSYQQSLNSVRLTAKQQIKLYGKNIQQNLQLNQELLAVIASSNNLEFFLHQAKQQQVFQAQHFLNEVQKKLSNKTLFIGNSNQLLLANANSADDKSMISSLKTKLNTQAFKKKITKQLVFSNETAMAKYLIAIPLINANQEVFGYLGFLIDLTKLQQSLVNSLNKQKQIILISDQHGIIMLASKPEWLYRTFANLPYSVKKRLNKQFIEHKLFTQLAIASINNGILTTAITKSNNQTIAQSYAVYSEFLANQQLKIHYLTNIDPITTRSYFYAIFVLICSITLALLWLFFREKRQALNNQLKHQQTLKTLDIEFKQQQKLASMGMMATAIAHDINQPITAIKTESKIAKKYNQAGQTDEVENSLQHINNHAELLANITTQLKDFARKREINGHQSANIMQVLNESLTLHNNRLTQENIQCVINTFDQDLQVKIAHHQLQQVFNNLIQNACDAMQNIETKIIKINITTNETMVNIIFSDNGLGIEQSKINSLFTPFVSHKNNKNSMGLGLAICHDIISKVGGTIELLSEQTQAQSDRLQGAHFNISLFKDTIE